MEWNHKKMCIHNPTPNPYDCAACIGKAMLSRNNQIISQGLQQQYQATVSFGATGSGSSASDYQMFLTYAELSDGELMNKFYDEELAFKESLEREIEFLKSQTEKYIAAHRISFLNWVAKYRKQITEKRLNELKAFL